jgi:hypothetical protein
MRYLLTVLASRFCVQVTVLNWFRSYLSDRHQMFYFSGRTMAYYSVDCSVPQRCVLGPICFISYAEVVVDVISSHSVRSHCYADDMQLSMPVAVLQTSTASGLSYQHVQPMSRSGVHLDGLK